MRIRNAALTSPITTAEVETREFSPPPCREPRPKADGCNGGGKYLRFAETPAAKAEARASFDPRAKKREAHSPWGLS